MEDNHPIIPEQPIVHTPIESKKSNSLVIILGGFVLLGLGLVGGYFFAIRTKMVSPTPQNLQQSAQVSPTPESTNAIPTTPATTTNNVCESNELFYENEEFSLCYPNDMKLLQTSSTDMGQGIKNTMVDFGNGRETLSIKTYFQGGWGGSSCLENETTKLSGYKASRYSWPKIIANDQCSREYDSFVTLTNDTVDPYYIGLSKTTVDSKHAVDKTRFIRIEQSFQIKKK